MKTDNRMTRREMMISGGALTLGALATMGLSPALPKAEAVETPIPWPYKNIDPHEAAKIGYDSCYKAYCCYGVASGILIPLRRMVGEPYTSFPLPEALTLGAGGIAGWGTTCGALLGAATVIGFLAPFEQARFIVNELFNWYSKTSLPIFMPEKPKTTLTTKSVSNSPLCHISVGKWCEKADKPFKHPEQYERCARLTADVTAQAVTLLNSWKDGTFKPEHKLPMAAYGMPTQQNCMECHTVKAPEIRKQ